MQVKPEPLIFPFAKFLYGPGPGGFADSFQFSTKAMQCEEGLLELFLRGKKKNKQLSFCLYCYCETCSR